MIALLPDALVRAIVAACRIGRPLMIWGPPGCGKTAATEAASRALGWRYILRSAACMADATDISGYPMPDTLRLVMSWLRAGWLPVEDEDTLVCIDEISAAPGSVQLALMSLVHERRAGDYVVPSKVRFVLTGNRAGELGGAASGRLTPPLANRMLHVEATLDAQAHSVWGLSHGLHPAAIAFGRFRPAVYQYKGKASDIAFPTGRSLHMASDVLHGGFDETTEEALIHGAIGEAWGVELCAFLRAYRTLPNLDAILLSPDKAPVPGDDKPALQYAIAFGLSARMTPGNAAAVVTYLERMPLEYAVVAIKHATCEIEVGPDGKDRVTARAQSLHSTEAVVRWMVAHASDLS